MGTPAENAPLHVGIDLGTSGCRAVAIDGEGKLQGDAAVAMPSPERDGARVEQAPSVWWQAVEACLDALFQTVPPAAVATLAVDGTSGTVLLVDAVGEPVGPALLYNDGRATEEAALLADNAPRTSAAHGTASGLAKLLWLLRHGNTADGARVLAQADWVAGRLSGRFDTSDENNVLKMGYDPVAGEWPEWLEGLGVDRTLLPRVVAPGTALGPLDPAMARRFGLPPQTRMVAGTTDSTAAFIATGARHPGEAVTSLGSTLVVKVLSREPIFAPEYGVYSQPCWGLWLVGGGSNSGGAVLRQFFNDDQMKRLTFRLHPEHPTGLGYYPLPAPGERFPFNDPAMTPRLNPRPADPAVFFQGLLEGIAAIEAAAYRRLAALGAPYPVSVRSVGGGARNPCWTRIRRRLLGVPVDRTAHGEAAYGTALLARRGA